MTAAERLKHWLGTIAGVGVTVAVGVPALTSSHLPEPMASHWSLGGSADGSLPRLVALALFAAGIVVPTALSWPRQGRATTEPARLVGVLGFLSCLMALASVTSVWANWDRGHWQEAGRLPAAWLLAMLATPSFAGVALHGLARRAFPDESARLDPTLPLELREDERVFWVNGASNVWLTWVTLGVAAVGAVLLARGLLRAGALQLALAVCLELFSRIRVSVSGHFVTIRYGHLGWLRQRIQVARIVRATSSELVPMTHGGWGYRGSLTLLRRAAVVVRRGAALRLELAENRLFSITVDDAATAAKLLSGLLKRKERLAL